MVNTNNKKGVNRMKKQELINLGAVLNNKGVRNTKKILNNYLYFLAENKVNIKEITENSKHINIRYSTKTGRKEYLLHLDNTQLRANELIVSVN